MKKIDYYSYSRRLAILRKIIKKHEGSYLSPHWERIFLELCIEDGYISMSDVPLIVSKNSKIEIGNYRVENWKSDLHFLCYRTRITRTDRYNSYTDYMVSYPYIELSHYRPVYAP